MTVRNESIRLVVQQPALPKYRLPVFRELAARPGIDLHFHYAVNSVVESVDPEELAAQGTPMRTVRLGGASFHWHTPQWKYASRRTTDVLLLSWDSHYLSLVPALARARVAGVATVLWGHGYSKRETPWRRALRYGIGRMATAVLVYNHATARLLRESGFPPASVHVALNSLDQAPIAAAREEWRSRPNELAAFRRETGLGGGPVILFVSRLHADNRADLLIAATSRLRRRLPGTRVVIIGSGPDRSRLERIAASESMSEAVLFPGAIYEESALAPWFLTADVFCYPVNIGLSLLHAFGYGLPVITSDQLAAQNPEIEAMEPGINGLLYRDGDVDSLAAVLYDLINDDELRARLGRAALASVRDRFNVKTMVDGMEAAVRYAWQTSGDANRASAH